MRLDAVPAGRDIPNDFNVIIEIPAHADPIKYEVDKDTGALFVDRFIATSMHYPCNYGYVPKSLADDGDRCARDHAVRVAARRRRALPPVGRAEDGR
jgi:inorganic pyrophosphatase